MVQERKIYSSFHDIPPRDYMYFPKGTIEASKPGSFSRLELQHLLISMGVLTVAFAFVFTENNLIYGLSYGFKPEILPKGLLLSFLGIFTAFFFHELLHKFMAQKYGLWAEYRMFPLGLKLALFFGIFTPFVFAAPGAVMFMGDSREFETGKIAMAGPLTNIIISAGAFLIYSYVFFEQNIVGEIFGFICLINAFLATFNLLPFGPLDGVKIIRWNATVWIIMLIAAIFILMQIMSKFLLTF